MLNYLDNDYDMKLYDKIFNENVVVDQNQNNEFLIWIFMLFSSTFFTIGLCIYAYNYIFGGQMAENSGYNKQTVYIVRRILSENLEEDIVEYIKKNTKRPYKILSKKTYDSTVSHPEERLFMRYMKKLYKTNYDIFLMNDNVNRIDYDNYIYFAEIMRVKYKIMDFVKNTEENDSYEVNRLNRENRERITIRLN
jgi:hypothetical protein